MNTLIFIGLSGAFTYQCHEIGKNFRGSSTLIKNAMILIGNIGYLAYLALIIWSFWHFPWWQPIVTFIGSMLIGGITAMFFQRNKIGILLSPILTLLFLVLGVMDLFGY